MKVHVVMAQVRGGVDHDFLAVYSTPARALAFINAQEEQLQQCLVVWEVEVNEHPSDPYWAKPQTQSLAAAFHALASLPGDALPPDRVTGDDPEFVKLGTLLASIGREAGLTEAEAASFGSLRHEPDALAPVTLDDVRLLAREVGDPAKVEAWLDFPLEWAGDRTPRQLVTQGRGDAVIKYLHQIASGPSG